MTDTKYVFISHSNQPRDKGITDRLVAYLKSKKIDVWYDGMLSGKPYPGEIVAHLKNATAYILVESFNSLSSPEVVNEMGMIYDEKKKGKAFNPLLVDKSFFEDPSRFNENLGYYFGNRSDQGVDMSKFPDEDSAFQKMAEYLMPVMGESVNNIADFEIKDNMRRLVRYSGKDEFVSIPNGVKEISDEAFMFNKTLSRIEIPDSVETIGALAFCECKKLTSIVGMKGVKSCGRKAFDAIGVEFDRSNKYMLNGVVLGGEVIDRKLVIPDGARVIADDAFACAAAEEVILPEGLEHIGVNAFANNCRIKSIILPKSLKSLGERAFGGCISLKQVTLCGEEPQGFPEAFNIKITVEKKNV